MRDALGQHRFSFAPRWPKYTSLGLSSETVDELRALKSTNPDPVLTITCRTVRQQTEGLRPRLKVIGSADTSRLLRHRGIHIVRLRDILIILNSRSPWENLNCAYLFLRFEVLAAFLALSSGAYAQAPPSQAAGYDLVFADDFNPLSLSPNGGGNYNWFDGVWFWNPAPLSNISTTGTGLTLTWTANQGSDNTSIETFSTASPHYRTFQYGYFEVVMKWDVVTGAYPAVWLTPIEAAFGEDHYNGVQEQGEFDLFEGQAAQPHTYFGTVHDWKNLVGSANTNNSWQLSSDVDFSQYHKYGMLWVPGKVTGISTISH